MLYLCYTSCYTWVNDQPPFLYYMHYIFLSFVCGPSNGRKFFPQIYNSSQFCMTIAFSNPTKIKGVSVVFCVECNKKLNNLNEINYQYLGDVSFENVIPRTYKQSQTPRWYKGRWLLRARGVIQNRDQNFCHLGFYSKSKIIKKTAKIKNCSL